MAGDPSTLRLWKRFERRPLGKRIFSVAYAFKAPYFLTIRPRVVAVRPGYAELTMKKRWRVQNHIGTVHAIALCNLAEATMGLVAEATVPTDARWIPAAMNVRYLAKAGTDMRATSTIEPIGEVTEPRDVEVPVRVTDTDGTEVFDAVITIRVSPKPAR
jgi:acyl-coenzyme A thioesterase PaaI-like protein